MKKNIGFGMIGVVLVVAAVALVGLIGWRLYDADKGKQNNSSSQTSNTEIQGNITNRTQADTVAYLDIKELGVKIKLSDDIKDLTYNVQTLTDGFKVAKFSTKKLTVIDSNCDAAFGPLGSLEVTTVDTDRTGAKKVVDNVGTFRLDNYYISYSSPQALCSEKASGLTGQPSSAFRQALKTMQLDK